MWEGVADFILNEAHSVVQVVPIQEKEVRPTLILYLCLVVEIIQPCQANLTICPTFVRDGKAVRLSVPDLQMQCAVCLSPCWIVVLSFEYGCWCGVSPTCTDCDHCGDILLVPFSLFMLNTTLPSIDMFMNSVTTKWETTLIEAIDFTRSEPVL